MLPFVQRLAESIPAQMHGRALLVDSWLRVIGHGPANVFAIGDCSSIEVPSLRQYLEGRLLQSCGPAESIDQATLRRVTGEMLAENPHLKLHMALLQKLFKKYSVQDRLLTRAILRLADEMDCTLRSLPSTAQVAHQEGAYLAKMFNVMAKARIRSAAADQTRQAQAQAQLQTQTLTLAPISHYGPFLYRHAGTATYVGTKHAVVDLGSTWLGDRFLAFWLWRSIYLSEQVSLRTRFMVAFDWIKKFFFGRDTSNP